MRLRAALKLLESCPRNLVDLELLLVAPFDEGGGEFLTVVLGDLAGGAQPLRFNVHDDERGWQEVGG